MAEISNNLIAGLLIVAIVVSIAGLANTLTLVPFIQYTGFATQGTGLANISITSQVSITLIRNESIFGSGYTNTNTIHTIQTNTTNQWGDRNDQGWFNNGSEGNGTDYGQGAGPYVYPFVVENDGTDDSTCVKIFASAGAATWIGGVHQTALFKAMAKNNESSWGGTNTGCGGSQPDACNSNLHEEWQEVETSGSKKNLCESLNNSLCNDEIRVHFLLGLPDDTTEGSHQTTVTIEAAGTCA